jgi:hypothetical protein
VIGACCFRGKSWQSVMNGPLILIGRFSEDPPRQGEIFIGQGAELDPKSLQPKGPCMDAPTCHPKVTNVATSLDSLPSAGSDLLW